MVSLVVSVQVEKTRHYLLLREKLEATLAVGQDALCKSGDLSDFAKSPILSHCPGGSPALESPSQRQRELAAKVTTSPWLQLGTRPNTCLATFLVISLCWIKMHYNLYW